MRLNKKKCKFRVSSVKYQGQIFTAEGMKPNPEKIAAIKTSLRPGTWQEFADSVTKNSFTSQTSPVRH